MISDAFAKKFVARVGLVDAAGLLDQDGRATEALRQRAARAVVARAFGITPVVSGLLDGRVKLKGVFEALLFAAPAWAAMRIAAAGGVISQDFDISLDLVDAIRHANIAKQSRMKIGEYVEQGTLEILSPATSSLLRLFADDAKLLADGLHAYGTDAVTAGSQNLLSQATPAELLGAAVGRSQPVKVEAVKRYRQRAPTFGQTGYRRVANDAYFTIEANWLVPALLSAVDIRGPILEPCSGKGHLVDALRASGYAVKASELVDYGTGRSDISVGVDMFSLTEKDMEGIGSVVTNFPYDCDDEATHHILSIGKKHGLQLASLAKSAWVQPQVRRTLIHENPAFDRIIFLTSRPRWVEGTKMSPEQVYCWLVWDWQRDQSMAPTCHWRGK
jgi:hypothetical protein